MGRTSRTQRDAGFTLIELVVGMVLAGVLLAVVGGFLIKTFSGQEKSISEQRAIGAANSTIAQFGDDVKRARSSDRSPDKVKSDLILQDSLLRGDGSADGTDVKLDLRDVVEATATSFAFRADVMRDPPEDLTDPDECIRYYVPTAKKQLIREVWSRAQAPPATGCGGPGARLLDSRAQLKQVR